MPYAKPRARALNMRNIQCVHVGASASPAMAEVPPRVEYSLTKRGRTLGTIITAMRDWGTQWA